MERRQGFGHQMHDGIGLARQILYQGDVPDVAVPEAEAGVRAHLGREVLEVAGVGERVEGHHAIVGVSIQQVADDAAAHEARPARHEDAAGHGPGAGEGGDAVRTFW